MYGFSPAPEELDAYGNQRRKINLGYGQSQATNAFQRSSTLANQGAETQNLTRQFVQQRNKIPGAFISRGLLNSGIYAQGLQDYGQNRTQAFGDLGRKYQQMLGSLDLSRQQAAQSQVSDLADVDAQERLRRAQLAQEIRSL